MSAPILIHRQITRLLVANRGEIARRVFRTCRDAGIACVAVYSDADADAPHAREADVAVRLPGRTAAETYLRGDALVAAALAAGADAVHPGYGFLSENAEFARAVLDAGLVWVGPPPAAIEAMGSKIEAKRLMASAGVPVLDEPDPATVTAADLPLLVKASAGGGGRGMRVVHALADLPAELAAAAREAAAAFGDAAVFCEPYLPAGRHLEVQVLADAHGTVWTLGERDCSIQRRHQKVLEESPAPGVDEALRARLCDAAVRAARAVDYVGAGTVEFLADADGRFFFLEMNTRLQVEHPVTECVRGLDLVRLQLDVAEGAPLPPEPPEPRGHAIEARLYAEDPAAGGLPQSGPLHAFDVPGVDATFSVPLRHGLRVDAGVAAGSVVSTHYDPMLAKVIAWAPSRAAAARRLAAALAGARLHGPATNRDLLVRVLRHPEYLAGHTDTGFLARHAAELLAPPDPRLPRLSALAAALAGAAANRADAAVLGGLPSGWRNVVSAPRRAAYDGPSGLIDVEYRLDRTGNLVAPAYPDVALVSASPTQVVLALGGVAHRFAVGAYADAAFGDSIHVDSDLGSVRLHQRPRFGVPTPTTAAGSLLAPMPGTVVRVAVATGDRVHAGQPLLWVEAMKMEHAVTAPVAGVVTDLPAPPGSQVRQGGVLAVVNSSQEE
jgi:propionyl-CoA carboxylase alpha chain